MTSDLAAYLGAGVGLVFGLVDFFVLGRARQAVRRDGATRVGPVVQVVRVLQLVFLPVAGWFIGPLIASNIAG